MKFCKREIAALHAVKKQRSLGLPKYKRNKRLAIKVQSENYIFLSTYDASIRCFFAIYLPLHTGTAGQFIKHA
jgi:hypothetical protein